MEDKPETGANSNKFSPSSLTKRIKGFDLVNAVKEVATVAFIPPKFEMNKYIYNPENPSSSGAARDYQNEMKRQTEMLNTTNEAGLKQFKEISDLHKAPEIKGVEDGAGTMILELKLN